MSEQIIIGIDPGYADAGFGVIDVSGRPERVLDYGSIRTPADQLAGQRLKRLYDELAKLFAAHRPLCVAVEKLYFSKNVKTAMAVAEARGVILLCAEAHGLTCREFAPAEVKLAVCGQGAADKAQVQKMVKMLLGLKTVPKPDDAADALALALAAAYTRDFSRQRPA
jgi:crossover junction endodeoxyribonuclease RuvC